MRVLALTGGIGSGKSTVLEMFAALGAEVVDADQLARELVQPGQPALAEIAQAFGPSMLLPDGSLDRGRLGSLIFGDTTARLRLNAITHPRIRRRIMEEIEARRPRDGVLVLDIPLLYENGLANLAEAVVVVWVDPKTQLTRLVERNGLSEEDARRRIAVQRPLDEKRALAELVVDNNGSLAETRRQVAEIYQRYVS